MKSYEALHDKVQDLNAEGNPHSFHIQWMHPESPTNQDFPLFFHYMIS